MTNSVILSGSANPELSNIIASNLEVKLGEIEIESFPNRETRIRILTDVRGKTVFIVQPTSQPVNDNIIQLALIADAANRAGSKKIVAIIPWFGYSPQDKVFREGEPLSSELVIRILESAPIDEFVVVDIHSTFVLNMFKKKVHHLSAMSIFVDYFKDKLGIEEYKGTWCSVALDKGALGRAQLFSEALGIPLKKFDKTRDRKTGEVTFHNLDGDVNGMNVISFDDFISTGGTRIQGCDYLKRAGALKYFDCCTHLIVPETAEKLKESNIDRCFITDTIKLDDKYKFDKLEILSIAPILVEFIKHQEVGE